MIAAYIKIIIEFIKNSNSVAKAWITSLGFVLIVIWFFQDRDSKRVNLCQKTITHMREDHAAQIKSLVEAQDSYVDALKKANIQDALDFAATIKGDLKKADVKFNRIQSSVREIRTEINKKTNDIEEKYNEIENEDNPSNTVTY